VVVTFDLERFEWAAPDRLQVAGTFAGLDDASAGAPELVLRGGGSEHRLESDAPAPADGRPWMATFAWREAPEPFDSAELRLGSDVAVELPQPGPLDPQRLEVRQAAPPESVAANGAGAGAGEPASENDAGSPTERAQDSGTGSPAERLRLQGDLLAAEEEAREAHALADRAMEELSRAHQDLDAERERHAADAERFREGLATVRASAEEALAAEQRSVAELRDQLTAAESARADAQATIAALEERLEALEQNHEDHERLRAEVELARVQTAAARARREAAHREAGEARGDVERLLERLKALHESLDDAG
jgi:hypothetical protein